MALCAAPNPSTGALTIVSPQPDTLAGCPYVIQSGPEILSNPFLMTRAEALSLGVQIALVWVAVALVVHVARRV